MLKVQAAHSSQAALLNWVSTSYPSSTVNSPTFTTDRGYAGDGVSSYVASGYVPSADSNWTSTDHSFGRVLNTFACAAMILAFLIIGASKYAYDNHNRFRHVHVTVVEFRLYRELHKQFLDKRVTQRLAFLILVMNCIQMGVSCDETVSGSSTSSIEMRIGSVEVATVSPSAYSASGQRSLCGKGLTSGEALALYTALQNYTDGN